MLLIDTVDNPLIDGIFHRIYVKYSSYFDWLSELESHTLDMNYYLGHSGEKTITSFFQRLIDMESSGTIQSALDAVADAIKLKYGDQWNRLYNAYIKEHYKPLENYAMIEEEKIGSKVTNSRSTSTGSYGFNSDESVPTDNGEETTTTSGSKDDNQRELTRSGNIGVTTSQQMLQSEIDLRKWNFFNSIMSDVDKELTLMIYE